MGRPKKTIDYETVLKLAGLQCTQEEISNFLDISVRTLQRDEEFCRVYKKGMDNGRMSLRRMQYKAAEKGNVSMLIWLGKQYLGQSDKMEATVAQIDDETRKAVEDFLNDEGTRTNTDQT